MARRDVGERLAGALEDELAVVRGVAWEPFLAIQTVAFNWLSDLPLRKAIEQLDSTPEKLLAVIRVEATEPVRGQNRTWAKLAAMLGRLHPELRPSALSELEEELDRNPELCARELLRRIADLAGSLPRIVESERRELMERLRALIPESRRPRDLEPSLLSEQQFSAGVRDALRNLNSEVQFLTIEQVGALEESFRSQRLWLEGPAGSGKTLLAIERVYRTLEAGGDCMVVFRSTQFRHILGRILDVGPGRLALVSHVDFSSLLWELDEATDHEGARDAIAEFLPWDHLPADGHPIELLIVDDYGVAESPPKYVPLFEKIARRVMLLVGPDQEVVHLYAEDPPENAAAIPPTVAPLMWTNREFSCPAGYSIRSLSHNLRNSRAIVDYGNKLLGSSVAAAAKERGSRALVHSSWQDLDRDLLDQISSLLEYFPPSSIKILVDPYLEPAEEDGLTADEFLERRPELLDRLSPIARGILCSASGKFSNGSLQQGAEDSLRSILSERTQADVRLVYADGLESHAIRIQDLHPKGLNRRFDDHFTAWRTSRVHAPGILEPHVLADPFGTADALLIYSAALFVGLESDVVIYVRNRQDPYESRDESQRDAISRIRSRHHYMAVSRARFHLLEMTVD